MIFKTARFGGPFFLLAAVPACFRRRFATIKARRAALYR
jgi:hypothetical protein